MRVAHGTGPRGDSCMTSLHDFWGAYLRAHARRATRVVHYLATALGIAGVAWSIMSLDPWPGLIAIAFGYALAIGAHRFVEHNQPLILANPVWGALSDMRMCLLALSGRLGRELNRHGVRPRGEQRSAEAAAGKPPGPAPARH